MLHKLLIILVLLSFRLLGTDAAIAQEQPSIAMPPNPVQIPPPLTQDDDTHYENLQRKRNQRQERDRPKNIEAKRERAQHQALYKESTQDRERQAYFDISLLLVNSVTTGNRSDFTDNPTSHFNFLWRAGGKNQDGKTGAFYGFRLAPFSGTGQVAEVPGSFGLTYVGPSLGWGKFDAFPGDYGQPATDPSQPKGLPQLPVVNGWVVTTGIAAQNRASFADKNEEEPDANEEFASERIDFDTPGLWLEGRIIRIHYGATGYSTVFGVQTGRKKAFFYLGVAAIALY